MEETVHCSFYSTAEALNTVTSKDNVDKNQDAIESKSVLTINLENVPKSVLDKNAPANIVHSTSLSKNEQSLKSIDWQQTFVSMKLPNKNCDDKTTIQITNVISLATDVNGGNITDNSSKELEPLMKNEHINTDSDINCLVDITRSAEDVSSEHNCLFSSNSKPSKKQTICDPVLSPSKLLTDNEQPSHCTNIELCAVHSEHSIRDQSPCTKIEPCHQLDNDQFKNIEFSAIFSSLEDYSYQDSFEENSLASAENLNWEHSCDEIQKNLIIDLDNQSEISRCRFYEESESLALSANKQDKTYYKDVQREFCDKSSFAVDYGEFYDKSKHYKLDSRDLDMHNSFCQNFGEASDPNLHYFGHKTWLHPQYPSQALKRTLIAATVNSFDSPLNSTFLDRPSPDAMYSDNNNDCYSQNLFDQYYYHTVQDDHAVNYSEWNQWSGIGNSATNLYDVTKSSESSSWTAPLSDLKSYTNSPENSLMSQVDSADDEETDDADEIDNLPTTFRLITDDIKSSPICMSPRSLSASPRSSCTPVSTISLDSQSSDVLKACCSPWPVALSCINNSVNPGKNVLIPNCLLSTEQLESNLFSYGMENDIKLPFPSMADVMRRNRLAAKSSCIKKPDDDKNTTFPRRCGRPRKDQIQSAKISTSTSKVTKAKSKASNKNKIQYTQNAVNVNGGDYDEMKGNSSRVVRHNEPLNEKAVCIMSKWYKDNISNPYPSKADKEEMARKGGITENQVKSWFANKRNRTNNTKPKVQKRVMEQKLRELFKDLKHSHGTHSSDNTHIIKQLSGILQHCHSKQT